jgi:hypothetical protein
MDAVPTLPRISFNPKGLSTLEKARLLYDQELAWHKTKPSPPKPTPFSRLSATKLPWNRKGALRDYVRPWEKPKGPKGGVRRIKAAEIIRKWWVFHRQSLAMFRLRVVFYQHQKITQRRVADFGADQLRVLEAQRRVHGEDTRALHGEALRQGGEWSTALEEQSQARQVAEREFRARAEENAERIEATAREIDEEKERKLQDAIDEARQRTEADHTRRDAATAKKAAEARRLANERARIKAEAEAKCEETSARHARRASVEAQDKVRGDERVEVPETQDDEPVGELEDAQQ